MDLMFEAVDLAKFQTTFVATRTGSPHSQQAVGQGESENRGQGVAVVLLPKLCFSSFGCF